MKIKDFLLLFILEIATAPIVILLFKFIEPKKVAASIAGVLFITIGLVIVYKTYRWSNRWTSITFWSSVLFTFGVAIPMFVMRSLNFELEMQDIRIWGIPGPLFHSLSNKVFGIMIVGTVVDYYRLRLSSLKRNKDNPSQSH